MRSSRVLTTLIILCLSSTSGSLYASNDFAPPQSSCDLLLESQQSGGARDLALDRYFETLARRWQQGWSARGFLGQIDGGPGLDALTYMYAMKHGVMWWNLRIYFAKSVEDARAHHLSISDPLVQGVYVLADEKDVKFSSNDDQSALRSIDGQTFKQVLHSAGGLIEFDHQGQMSHISGDEADRRLNYLEMSKMTAPDTYSPDRQFFVHEGWATTKVRGIFEYSDWQKSDTIKKTRKLARALVRAGYRLRVNQNFQLALDMARDQLRGGSANSRYNKKSLYSASLEMYRRGQAFSVELYSPDGDLLGGSINFRSGNLIIGDTVFYNTSKTSYTDELGQARPIDPIDFSKVADVVSFDHMNATGISWLDVGMVSKYSASLKGRLVERGEYLEKIASLPQELVSFPEALDPYQYPNVDFKELAKSADVKGVARAKFLGGLPMVTASSIIEAIKVGLRPAKLHIFVVPSLEAARAIVTQLNSLPSQGDSEPIFFIGESKDSSGALLSPRAVLEKMLETGAKFFPNPNEPLTKIIRPEQLKQVILPTLSTDYISWSQDGSHIVVKGWATQRLVLIN